MSEPEITGEVVKAPPAVEMRYDEDDPVTRVFIRFERKSGKIREYQAREPQDFEVKESMTAVQSRGRISAGGLFTPLSMAVPSLRLSFTAHPRWNLHIRTEATAPEEFEGITY